MFSLVLILDSITTTHFEVKYCDFILYSNVSVAHIERIYKDANLQEKNVKYSKIFWSEFSILEYYLLVNPPPLLPIIFSDKFS